MPFSNLTNSTGELIAAVVDVLEGEGYSWNRSTTTFNEYLATALTGLRGSPASHLRMTATEMLSAIDFELDGDLQSNLRFSLGELLSEVADTEDSEEPPPDEGVNERGVYVEGGVPSVVGAVVFEPTNVLSSSDSNPDTGFRIAATLSGDMNDQFRIVLRAAAAASMQITRAGFGKQSAADVATATLEDITFGGSNIEFNVGAGFYVVSDWMSLNGLDLNSGDEMMVGFSMSSTGGTALSGGNSNGTSYFGSTSDLMNADPNYSSSAGNVFGLVRIETRAATGELPDDYIPLTFDDEIFDDTVTFVDRVLSSGQVLIGGSSTTSADPAAVVMQANNRIRLVRVDNRECVRVAGNGDFEIEYCYLEAEGLVEEDDHADTVQVFGGSDGTVTVRNSTIRAYNQAATAGFFAADGWQGNLVFEHVVFQGGPYGLRLHADTELGMNVSLSNVYFVGPFGTAPYFFNPVAGPVNVILWENVFEATIVDGVLVPGNAIPAP